MPSKSFHGFGKLNRQTMVDDEAIDACLKEVAAALLHADVRADGDRVRVFVLRSSPRLLTPVFVVQVLCSVLCCVSSAATYRPSVCVIVDGPLQESTPLLRMQRPLGGPQVNVKAVAGLRSSVKSKLAIDEAMSTGTNRRRMVLAAPRRTEAISKCIPALTTHSTLSTR